jgi:isoamylase
MSPSHLPALQRLRQRQMRNMVVALMVAHGVPMITMGDEYGHSKQGNNNTYCHDSELNWFNWQQVGSRPTWVDVAVEASTGQGWPHSHV